MESIRANVIEYSSITISSQLPPSPKILPRMLNLWTRCGIGGVDKRALIAGVSCRTRDDIKYEKQNTKITDIITRAWEHCGGRADIVGRSLQYKNMRRVKNNEKGSATLICEKGGEIVQSHCLTISCMLSKVFGAMKGGAQKRPMNEKQHLTHNDK